MAHVRRYALVIALVVVAALSVSTWLTSRQERLYEATATVLLRTPQTLPLFSFGSAGRPELNRQPETEQLYLDSETFQSIVRPQAPAGTSSSAEALSTGSIVFRSRSTSPDDAAVAADLWASRYVGLRHESVLAENSAALDFIAATLADLETERAEIRKDVVALESVIDRTEDPDQYARLLSQKVSIETQLQTQLAPVDQQIRDLSTQLANLELVARFLDDSSISARVERTAAVPSTPVSPNQLRNATTAIALGLIVGTGVSYAHAALNIRVRDDLQVTSSTGVPILGTVPHYKLSPGARVEVVENPASIVSERYRSIVTAIEFAATDRPLSSLLVTSAMPAEGKSTTAINLAALISMHTSVLLIDADMRRPRLDSMLGVSMSSGLSEVLTGAVDVDDVIAVVEHTNGSFGLLAAGSIIPDPTLLLRNESFRLLIQKLESRFDLVIVDSAPVLPVTDALLIGRCVSAQILITRAGKTSVDELRAASQMMRSSGAPIIGAVMNGDRSRPTRYVYTSSPGSVDGAP